MKRMILTGTLVLATGLTALMAQPQKGNAPAQPQAQQGQKPTGPAPKSQAEAQALQGLMQAQQQGNPDAVIKAGDEFLTKYADTDFKEPVLLTMANAYQQKGDNDKAQIYGERVLEVNPKNFQS